MNIRDAMNRRQSAAFALRILLGYPRQRPASDPVAFCAAGPMQFGGATQIGGIAADLGQDLVVLHHNLETEEIESISLAIRRTVMISIFRDCEVYAASQTAPLQILDGQNAWRLGDRNMLVARKLPPAKRLKRGIEIARRRWSAAAENVGPLHLEGGRCVPIGATLASALDMGEAIRAAAA